MFFLCFPLNSLYIFTEILFYRRVMIKIWFSKKFGVLSCLVYSKVVFGVVMQRFSNFLSSGHFRWLMQCWGWFISFSNRLRLSSKQSWCNFSRVRRYEENRKPERKSEAHFTGYKYNKHQFIGVPYACAPSRIDSVKSWMAFWPPALMHIISTPRYARDYNLTADDGKSGRGKGTLEFIPALMSSMFMDGLRDTIYGNRYNCGPTIIYCFRTSNNITQHAAKTSHSTVIKMITYLQTISTNYNDFVDNWKIV